MAQKTHSQAMFFLQSKPAGGTLFRGCIELTDESLSVSTLAAPARPLGFDADIHYDTSEILNALGVYLCAIDVMYHFAQTGWFKRLAGGLEVWVDGFNMEIDIEKSQEPHGGFQLQTNHIVFGLYETIVDISAHSRFCQVLTTLSMHRRQIGTLVIQKRASMAPEKEIANAKSLILVNGSSISNAATYPSGLVIDPENPSFSIAYNYSGIRINSKDIFLAVLDALATAAEFSPSTSFRSLNAISASGDCAISILEVDSQFQMTYSYVTKALRAMIVDIMVYLRKFEEMTLELKWQASKIAEGSIRLAGQRNIV